MLLKGSHSLRTDLHMFTSGMTYWYPGVFKLMKLQKNSFKKTLFWVEFMQPSVMRCKKALRCGYYLYGKGELEALKLNSEQLNSTIRIRNPH